MDAPLLASPVQRIGAYLLEACLVGVTMWIGYIVWSAFIYGRGQTPGKQLLNLRVIDISQKHCPSWGTMAGREWLMKVWFVGLIGSLLEVAAEPPAGLYLMFLFVIVLWMLANTVMLFRAERHQTAWDKLIGTVVIYDRDGEFDPRRTGRRGVQAARRQAQRAW